MSQPRIIATLNNYEARAAELFGDYGWHSDDASDDLFLITRGELTLDLRDDSGQYSVAPASEIAVCRAPRSVVETPGGATAIATTSGSHFGLRRSTPVIGGIAVALAAMAASAAAGLWNGLSRMAGLEYR